MSDKTMVIILAIINFLLWFIAVDYMVMARKAMIEIEKNNREFIVKCNEYWHKTFQDINKMVTMNLTGLQHFSEEISDKMSNEGIKQNETEDRK